MIREFLHLFRGNPHVVGMDDGLGPDMPGPLRLQPDEADQHWLVLAEGHLGGHVGIGVYPYNHEREAVAWGCVDLDEGEYESWGHALNLRHFLYSVGVTAWIERSRSKGYHVWIFSEWTPASWVRRLLVGACEEVGAPSREVNPKSPRLDTDQLGNFVRLPYKGMVSRGDKQRQVIVDLMGYPMPLFLFINEALEHTLVTKELVAIARELYIPPEPRTRFATSRNGGEWQERLVGLAEKQLEEGPRPGSDRSTYLMAFGHACAESGLTEEEIVAAVRLADELHCNKYAPRRDAERRYSDIAHKALEMIA